jgi:uncharacterized paraquat-inducible protein A
MAKSNPASALPPSRSYYSVLRLLSQPPRRRGWRTARRHTLCRQCEAHEARSHRRGKVGYRRDHDLCPRCFRLLRERHRARLLREGSWFTLPILSGGAR